MLCTTVLRKCCLIFQGVGIAYFNMAKGGVAGGKTPDVRPLTAYVLPYYLKTSPFKTIKEGCKAAPRRISG